MLDPLTALGLAGNLIQVIQFSYDIVSEGNKIYHDAGGVLTQNKTTEEVATDLANLTGTLKTKQEEWRVAHGGKALEPDETRLRNLCDRCAEVSYELQIQLNKLKAKEGKGKRLRSYKAALISVWRKDDVEEIARRLARYQKELDTRVLFGIRQSLQEAEVRETEQFNTLDQRTKDLTVAVLDHHGNFDTKLDHHADILAQIAAGQIKTHDLLQVVVGAAQTPSPALPTYDQATVVVGSTAASPSPLHEASAGGQTTRLRQLLRDASVNINARDEQGCTPLHLAPNADIARFLLRDKRVDHGAEDYAGRSALHYAVLTRRLDVANLLLANNIDKEWQDDLGKTALFYAQDCSAATWMLRYGAEIEAKASDHPNNTGLIHLAWLGDKEGTAFYLAQGAAIDARNDIGETALTESSRHGDVQIVELLLAHGANTELAAGNEWTPLLQAIRDGREAVVRILVKHGAKKRATLSSGHNTLSEACWRKQFAIARILIEAGVRIDVRDCQKATPLFKAAFSGDVPFVRWALHQGADPNAQNEASLTPLFVACEQGHSEVATLLLEAAASHQMKSPDNWTPLTIAATRGRNKCVKALLLHGAGPNVKGHFQHTALAEASHHGHPQMIKRLIEAGADIEATVVSGFTPLGVAAHTGQDECVRVLVAAGAKLEARDFGGRMPEGNITPLMRAARYNRPSTIHLLHSLGAILEARDPATGQTALHLAASEQHLHAVRALLESGADVNAVDSSGHSALHVAARLGHEGIVRLLLEKGARVGGRDRLGRTAWITAVHFGMDGRVLGGLFRGEEEEEEGLRCLVRGGRVGEVARRMNEIYS